MNAARKLKANVVAPKNLTKDELYALVLSLQGEMERCAEVFGQIDDFIRSESKEAKRFFDADPKVSEEKEKLYSYVVRRFDLEFKRWTEPERTTWSGFGAHLRSVVGGLKERLKETATEEWRAVQALVAAIPSGWKDVESQEEDLFNEGRLYDALGKDDARTVLALWGRFHEIRKAGERIGWVGPKPKKGLEAKLLHFRESDLFGKLDHLMRWGRTLADLFEFEILPEDKTKLRSTSEDAEAEYERTRAASNDTLRIDKSKVDRHTVYQIRNFKRQVDHLSKQFEVAYKALREKGHA